jgi:RimJ/RimL family protein N-acetyltransferase
VIELARVRLRPLEARDGPSLYATYADPVTARYLSRPPLTDCAQGDEMAARAVTGNADGTSVQLAIERRADHAFLGMCLLFHFNEQCARAEIGYTLMREHWAQGYMAESLPGLIEHAFGPLNLNRLEADIDPRNSPSERVLLKMGFKREGLLRERWIVAGETSDSALLGLIKRDWRARVRP